MSSGPLSGPIAGPVARGNAGDDEVVSGGAVGDFLLMETGDRLLLETGDKIKLESSP